MWTREKIYKLLSLVEAKECLWNVTSKNYHDQNERKCALSDISKELNLPPDEVKKKLHTLRAQYSKEKLKLKNIKSGSGLNENCAPKWEYFKSMQFMFQHNVGERNTESMEMQHEIDESENINSDANNIAMLKTKSPPKKKRKILEVQENDAIKNCMNIISNARPRDEYSVFGEYVASELRSIKDAPDIIFSLKNSIQRDIINYTSQYAARKFQTCSTSSSPHQISLHTPATVISSDSNATAFDIQLFENDEQLDIVEI